MKNALVSRMWPRAWPLVALLACTDPGGALDRDISPGGPPVGSDLGPTPTDQGVLPEVGPFEDAGTLLGGFGAACQDNAECASGYCIEAAGGGRMCTQLCGTCPAGFECTLLQNGGADAVQICAPDQPHVCTPCRTDMDCDDDGDLCVRIGTGLYCGEDCATQDDCPLGFVCAETVGEDNAPRGLQCVPAGGQGCEPCLDADADGYGDGGDCLGADCDDTDPDVHPGVPELCDGRDNNCDLLVDELEALVVPPDLAPCLDTGVCAGAVQRCVGGTWACSYPETFVPGDEVGCDRLDNNCDGETDEGVDLDGDSLNCGVCGLVCFFHNADSGCVGGECVFGECAPGWQDVDGSADTGCEYLCVPSMGGVEICDAVDNDCNGTVDDSIEGESCDGFDNDCDGEVDEDFDLDLDQQNCGRCGLPCAFDHAEAGCAGGRCVLGTCGADWYDADRQAGNGCEYSCLTSHGGVEACDLEDNDCDGEVDEDFTLRWDAENCGACGVACEFDNATALCVEAECLRLDCLEGFHDVDGEAENGCEYACEVSNGGVELCNGIDDDCDRVPDDEIDLSSDPANCGECNRRCTLPNAASLCHEGECAIGLCMGAFQDLDGEPGNGCEYGCLPSGVPGNEGVELCDNLDNDCDGLVDEDFDLLGDSSTCGFCDRVCASPNALWGCSEGHCVFDGCAQGFVDLDAQPENGCALRCTPQNGGVETCNGMDDDCNGLVDEGVLNVCGECGDPPTEECNGFDDDCDGLTDEGVLNACGVCGPTPEEVCDSEDNDCDGQVDEGLRNRCGTCGPEPAEACDGSDNDCDGLTDNHGACGPYVQVACRWFVGWADSNRGPNGASPTWSECPNRDKSYANALRCVGTRRDGRFMQLDVNGDMDDNDRLAMAFLCDDAANPAVAQYVETHCGIYLGYADNDAGPDAVQAWGACPPQIVSDVAPHRCTTSGFDRQFRRINLDGDVDFNDDLAVAFKCVDGVDPGRAWSIQQSVSLVMGWADVNRGAGDGAATWGPCPSQAAGEVNGQRCVSTLGDGLFRRLDLGGDVGADDDFGFALRARAAP